VSDLRYGRIVRVELFDPQGRNPKVRPAVILTPTADITPDGEIQVAAITGETTAAPAEDCVPLPWHRSGHPTTKLTKPSVVVVTWLARVRVSAVERIAGAVPTPQLIEITRKIVVPSGEPTSEQTDPVVPPTPPTG
jgi:hypothetical protein